jgi:hypothetical protein
VTIRDSSSLEVVTILEVLSPINKAPSTSQARADGRYADQVDYAASPPPPALNTADASWAAEQVRRWRASEAPLNPELQA